MQSVAAIPTTGLLVGSAAGLIFSDSPLFPGFLAIFAAVAAAAWAWRTSRSMILIASVSLGFAGGGFLLAVDAWRSTWNPPLLERFEAAARIEREEAARAGRFLPEDDTAALWITGVLNADAAVRQDSVSLNVSVRDPAAGGALLTVSGDLAAREAHRWRAGRMIRVSAQLRRPSHYLDPGVPDEERALARRGTRL